MDNTSGQGSAAAVPDEVRGWNWGAFLLNWIWGIGNRTYIALLMFVPVVNMVMPFVLGAKGSAWAWRNKKWDGVEHFKHVQRKWTIAGIIVLVATIVLLVVVYFSVMAWLKDSVPYQLAVEKLNGNKEAMNALGAPVSTGYPMGSARISGPQGHALFSIQVEGTKAHGSLNVDAVKDLGQWKLRRIQLDIAGRQPINLLAPPAPHPKPAAPPAPAPVLPTPLPETKPAPASTPAAEPAAAPIAPSPPAKPERPQRAPATRHATDADARKCLELNGNMAVARCAEAYR